MVSTCKFANLLFLPCLLIWIDDALLERTSSGVLLGIVSRKDIYQQEFRSNTCVPIVGMLCN